MKSKNIINLVKKLLKEQTTVDKNVSGPCTNKTLQDLAATGALPAMQEAWNVWSENPQMPYFLLTDPNATTDLAQNALLQSQFGGNFIDNYYQINPGLGQMTEPYCPYIYIAELTFTFTTPNGPYSATVSSFAELLSYFIETFEPMFNILADPGADTPIPTNILDFLTFVNGLEQVEFSYPSQIVVLLCNCEWTYTQWGCTDPEATNFNDQAQEDNGSCEYLCDAYDLFFPQVANTFCDQCCAGIQSNINSGICECCPEDHCVDGCTDSSAFNYNTDANSDDGSCIPVVEGCTDSTAGNFEENANTDNGSCWFLADCTDPGAINYNSQADQDDGSCFYTPGCTDIDALNYNDNADHDDGSCGYTLGCMDSSALTFSNDADFDDGEQCFYVVGCMDPDAVNYQSDADISVEDFESITGIDTIFGFVNPVTGEALSYFVYPCYYNPGCTNPEAANYDPEADFNNGSCIEAIYGCMDELALNFNAAANTPCNYIENSIAVEGGTFGNVTITGIENDCCEYEECLPVNTLPGDELSFFCGNCCAETYENIFAGGDESPSAELCGCCNCPGGETFTDLDTDDEADPLKDVPGIERPDKPDVSVIKPDPGATDSFGNPVSPTRPRVPGEKDPDDKPGYVRPTGIDKPDPMLEPEGPVGGPGAPTQGCMDESACNYNPNAEADDYDMCINPGDSCIADPNYFGFPSPPPASVMGTINNACECIDNPDSGPDMCNSQSSVCFEDCEEFDCQACFDNYVSMNSLMPTYIFDLSNQFNPFVNGPCQSYGYYANNSINQSGGDPTMGAGSNEFIPDDGRPSEYNHWHSGKLNENFIKRFKKLANIKNKKK